MSSVSQLRAGIATNLGTISGLRTASTMPDNPNPPIAIVIPNNIDYHTAFAQGMQTYGFTVILIVGRVDERTAQNRLDSFVSSTGSNSVKLAIESDKTLGGAAFDCTVTEMRNYGQLSVGEVVYLSSEFTIVVYSD